MLSTKHPYQFPKIVKGSIVEDSFHQKAVANILLFLFRCVTEQITMFSNHFLPNIRFNF